eukprot:1084607-Rhodomonas_salina.2
MHLHEGSQRSPYWFSCAPYASSVPHIALARYRVSADSLSQYRTPRVHTPSQYRTAHSHSLCQYAIRCLRTTPHVTICYISVPSIGCPYAMPVPHV